MSYLRLIQTKIQNLSETVAQALNVEVAIADKNLTRIVGTGNFYEKIDETCSHDSLFAKVIRDGEIIINLERNEHCIGCSNQKDCREFANMSYPIKEKKQVIGVLSFASFDANQANIMRFKKDEYFNMLKETAGIIEQEIENIHIVNELKKDITEVSEIINCLNKGIIILNSEKEIIHINSTALEILNINISEEKIIERNIGNFINGINLQETINFDTVGCWNIKGEDIRVIYNINKIKIGENEFSLMISFEFIRDIINLAKTYVNREKIYFENIIGNSKSFLKSINKSKIAASTDSTILIQGDSGTGKELFARSIHNESPRRKGPFIAINCASIPENLIESELFGYEKGAFTGANINGKKGLIELANNGTIFLDEIGDLPIYMQTKLLRVLQERSIQRLGAEKLIDINIRVISATNKDLRQMVSKGEFRLDLFYRLNVIPIKLPPLRDREEDVFLCSRYIINKHCHRMNKEEKILSEEVKTLFNRYSWPGNIRELENVLEHGICFSQNEYIELENLPEYILEQSDLDEFKDRNFKLDLKQNKTLEDLKLEYEKDIINQLLLEFGDTVEGKKMVAKKLNIGLTTLYRKINAYYS